MIWFSAPAFSRLSSLPFLTFSVSSSGVGFSESWVFDAFLSRLGSSSSLLTSVLHDCPIFTIFAATFPSDPFCGLVLGVPADFLLPSSFGILPVCSSSASMNGSRICSSFVSSSSSTVLPMMATTSVFRLSRSALLASGFWLIHPLAFVMTRFKRSLFDGFWNFTGSSSSYIFVYNPTRFAVELLSGSSLSRVWLSRFWRFSFTPCFSAFGVSRLESSLA